MKFPVWFYVFMAITILFAILPGIKGAWDWSTAKIAAAQAAKTNP